MPMKWDESNKLTLILEVLKQSNPALRFDAQEISLNWPTEPKPSARAVKNAMGDIKKLARGGPSASSVPVTPRVSSSCSKVANRGHGNRAPTARSIPLHGGLRGKMNRNGRPGSARSSFQDTEDCDSDEDIKDSDGECISTPSDITSSKRSATTSTSISTSPISTQSSPTTTSPKDDRAAKRVKREGFSTRNRGCNAAHPLEINDAGLNADPASPLTPDEEGDDEELMD